MGELAEESKAPEAEVRAALVSALLSGDKFAEQVLDDARMESGQVPLRTARLALSARNLHIEGSGSGSGAGSGSGYGSKRSWAYTEGEHT